MGISAPLLAFAALGIALIVWGFYLVNVAKNSVPEMPVISIVLLLATLAAAGFALADTPSAAVIAPSAFSLTLAVLFLYLMTQRKTPVGDLTVGVRDRLLPFSAKNSDGTDFDSASLDGQRILLKFFRGSW